ncbi:hypothetical protein M1615_03315 [Patescibacteria group bacterium]|nr:hypothetical protein [Patescibacteria group bacterium]
MSIKVQNTSSILQHFYKEDVEDRASKNWEFATIKDVSWLKRRDKKRKEAVLFLRDLDSIKTGLDYHHGAYILQHGETIEDFALAHEFAKKAVEKGDESAKWLFAATMDRYLLSIGKPQKYGTQFRTNRNGEPELETVDETTTDEERAKYNVPPLSEAVRRYKEKYGIK